MTSLTFCVPGASGGAGGPGVPAAILLRFGVVTLLFQWNDLDILSNVPENLLRLWVFPVAELLIAGFSGWKSCL